MRGPIGRSALGFVAAAIAVLTVHEGTIYLLAAGGLTRSSAWSMTPAIPPWGVPRLINNVFWGGLWGVLFAALYDKIPGGAGWLKGLIYGLTIVVVSNWILLPLIKGRVFGQAGQVLFSGFDPRRMLVTLIILGGFGIGLGIIYALMRGTALSSRR
jgi:hypothetical protein